MVAKQNNKKMRDNFSVTMKPGGETLNTQSTSSVLRVISVLFLLTFSTHCHAIQVTKDIAS